MDAKISKGIGTNNREETDETRAANMLLFEQGMKKKKRKKDAPAGYHFLNM